MLKRFLLFLSFLFIGANIVMAQDDDLPPPTSKPKGQPSDNNIPNNNDNDFTGFKKAKKVDWSKFIIEPDFNLNISPGEVDFGLSPYVGYEVYKNFYVGGGITYLYTGYSGLQVTDAFGNVLGNVRAYNHTYGAGVFLQYNIWKGLFARAKFELLERNVSDQDAPAYPNNPAGFAANPTGYTGGFYIPRLNVTEPDLLVGVGYNLLRSKNFFFPIIVSYNLLQGASNPEYAIYTHAWVVQLGFVNIF